MSAIVVLCLQAPSPAGQSAQGAPRTSTRRPWIDYGYIAGACVLFLSGLVFVAECLGWTMSDEVVGFVAIVPMLAAVGCFAYGLLDKFVINRGLPAGCVPTASKLWERS